MTDERQTATEVTQQKDTEMNELTRKAHRFEACEAQVILVQEAKEEWDGRKGEASIAKKRYDGRLDDLVTMIQERPPAAPLFDKGDDDEGEDDWHKITMEDLDISLNVCATLGDEAGILTVGDMAAFINGHGDFWHKEIAGIGDAARTEIENKMEAFFIKRKQDEPVDGEPAPEPEEPDENDK